ncbi:metallophosphoesterase [Kingella negevensis]|uniref:metallophosphoesterase n=1 Tax=Kingella negevensis TaxID=1522312 RepID=UPI002542D50E|nr:metallophosphoesterase [Kingella negevensis]MDK4685347.1 metallophosphoesterase [Kingella negevensis]MDK4707423.1 metallophosphoesterase [Kingella negevensis]MDK4710101.1 metallophosphoesterase [Kingella negevensis]WII92527.1 metallophosphoesterase [Kingella negevensis]
MKFFSIFTLVVLQAFTYGFARFLIWLFAVHSPKKRKAVYAATFLFGNGLMIAALMFRIHLMFRLSAAWMVLLLFALFTSLIVLFLEHVCRLIFRQPEKRERALRLLAPVILCGFFALAVYNAYTPIVRHAEITIDKPMAKPVRIGMAADTHLGVLVGARQLDKLADIMQQEKVDVILLPGDIMDDDTVAYLAENMQPHLQKLRAPLGVYATLGNHDYRETNSITQAIQAAGITVLDDEAVWVDDNFWVVGRPDNLEHNRLKTRDLLQKVNTQQPVFLLDHRPDEVTEHSELPIDVQVSGHVHNGQVFPANFIVRYLNRIAYGYGKINQTHFFVTSGFGFWGVPFRLGSQSEVWVIDVKGRE